MAIEWCQVCGSSVWSGQPCGKCAHDGVVATRDAEIARLKAEVERLAYELTIVRRNLDCARDDHDADLAAHKRALAAGPAAVRKQAGRCKGSKRSECLIDAAEIVVAAQVAAMKGEK